MSVLERGDSSPASRSFHGIRVGTIVTTSRASERSRYNTRFHLSTSSRNRDKDVRISPRVGERARAISSAFYYGGDGPAPDRKITILSTSAAVGSRADIAIDFGLTIPDMGTLSALVVDATTLRFTFSASWFSCGQPFDVSLTHY